MASTGPVTYGYASEAEAERNYLEQESLYGLKDSSPCDPGWLTQEFGFAALPPSGTPAAVPGSNPMYYLDAYYHALMQLAGQVEDLGAVEGPVLVVGSGMGGMLPIFRQHLPKLQRLIGLELLPPRVELCQARHGEIAEVVVGDMFKMQDKIPEESMQLIYDGVLLTVPLEENMFLSQGVHQMHRALRKGGLLVADATVHPIFCPLREVVAKLAAAGFEKVAELDISESIVAAGDLSEAHLRSCLSPVEQEQYAHVLKAHETENCYAKRSINQKYARVFVVFRKTDAPVAANPGDDAESVYTSGVVSWYDQYEMEGRAIPAWMRQLSYPCLMPKGMDQAPPVGVNHHFYLDAFYHRIMALAATVVDMPNFTGPCIFTGSGFAGMVPILRQHMPKLERLVAGDIVPFFLQIAKERGLDSQAELCELDVLALDKQFEPESFAMLADDAIVSHMRNDGGMNAHLFAPALQQVRAVLKPGGYFLPNGSLKYSTGQTSERVIHDIEAQGFKLLASEDLTADCLAACDLMEEHILGSADRPGCLTAEDRELYPELVDDVKDSFTEYYRYSMGKGGKGLAHWVFQKV